MFKNSVLTDASIGMASPIVFAHQTIKYEKNAIQNIDPKNVIGNHFADS